MTHIIDDCSGCWMPQALESALADNAALREQLVAARAKTLEEAAKALENNACRHAELNGYRDPAHCAESVAHFHCADAIRALRTAPPGIVLLDGTAGSTGSNTSIAPASTGTFK